jgi:hypothetical protein
VVIVSGNDATHNVTSIADTRGNTYALAVGPTVNTTGQGLSQSIFYAKNIAAGREHRHGHVRQQHVLPDVRVVEYAGADPIAPIDATAVGFGEAPPAAPRL